MLKRRLHESLITEEITKRELDMIEAFADKLFKKVNIDVEFTKHFLERLNDARNVKDITTAELVRLFKQTFKKHGKKLKEMDDNDQAVLNDLQTDINLPFVLKWNKQRKEFEMISKTIMRKKDFKTSNPKLKI